MKYKIGDVLFLNTDITGWSCVVKVIAFQEDKDYPYLLQKINGTSSSVYGAEESELEPLSKLHRYLYTYEETE
jgi:hypothetical protein